MNEKIWEDAIVRHIKAEMAKRKLDVPKLTELFLAHGYKETRNSIRGKVDRGKFGFIFYVQFMHVIGAKEMVIVPPEDGSDLSNMDISLR